MTVKEIQELCRRLNASPWQQRVLHEELTDTWKTGTPTESGLYLVCIRYNFKDYHTTAEYVEPFNPHTGWYNLKPPYDVNGEEWNKRKDLEVIAWQKIEPYRGHKERINDNQSQ